MGDSRDSGVEIDQGVADGDPDLEGFTLRDRFLPRHPLAQVVPGDIIHHQVLPLLVNHEIIENPRQVGMPQRGQDSSLTLKLTGVFLGEKRVFLDRNGNVQVLIDRAIDGTHPTLSEDVENAVSVI